MTNPADARILQALLDANSAAAIAFCDGHVVATNRQAHLLLRLENETETGLQTYEMIRSALDRADDSSVPLQPGTEREVDLKIAGEIVPVNLRTQTANVDENRLDLFWIERLSTDIEDDLEEALLKLYEVKQESMYDDLTQMFNRTKIYEMLDRDILASNAGESCLSVILADLDNFKIINDTHGHLCGDRVLRTFSQIARRTLPPGVNIGRWGGEEFLIVAPDCCISRATAVAEELRQTIEREDFACDGVTCSFGITTHEPGENIDRLIARCDIALYRAKSGGRNRCVQLPWKPGMSLEMPTSKCRLE